MNFREKSDGRKMKLLKKELRCAVFYKIKNFEILLNRFGGDTETGLDRVVGEYCKVRIWW